MLRGRVRTLLAQSTTSEPTSVWRVATMALLLTVLLPLSCATFAALLVSRATLSLLGVRGLGGGHGLSLLIVHGLLGGPRPDRKITVRHFIVDDGTRLVTARFDGDPLGGTIVEGHEVSLSGRTSRGTFHVHTGIDETTGAHFSRASDPWRTGFIVVCVLFLLGGTVLLVLPAHP